MGAGRKPGSRSAVVLGLDGKRLNADAVHQVTGTPDPVDEDGLLAPPSDLPREYRRYWARYAPSAIVQRTLIPAHVPGFRELCEQAAFKDALAKRIRRLKPESDNASDLLRHYEKLAQRLDATLARFKLTGFGKPAETGAGARKVAASPWAAVGR